MLFLLTYYIIEHCTLANTLSCVGKGCLGYHLKKKKKKSASGLGPDRCDGGMHVLAGMDMRILHMCDRFETNGAFIAINSNVAVN
jgi:hypothetical protein